MKIRRDFVTNSSSSSFIIRNKGKQKASVHDFLMENLGLIAQFNREYNDDVDFNEAIRSAKDDYAHVVLYPGDNSVTFGDEQGPLLGRVFDYILREGGSSKNFRWKFEESHR